MHTEHSTTTFANSHFNTFFLAGSLHLFHHISSLCIIFHSFHLCHYVLSDFTVSCFYLLTPLLFIISSQFHCICQLSSSLSMIACDSSSFSIRFHNFHVFASYVFIFTFSRHFSCIGVIVFMTFSPSFCFGIVFRHSSWFSSSLTRGTLGRIDLDYVPNSPNACESSVLLPEGGCCGRHRGHKYRRLMCPGLGSDYSQNVHEVMSGHGPRFSNAIKDPALFDPALFLHVLTRLDVALVNSVIAACLGLGLGARCCSCL